MKNVLLGCLLLCLFSGVSAQEKIHVLRGAKIYPITSEPLENGALIIHKGKILAVDNSAALETPAGAVEIDAGGMVLMPGMVDTHSHIGGGDGGDRSATLHPDVRILDAINVHNDHFMKARTGGITTANVMSGSGYLMSGQTAYLKLRNARTINDMLFCKDVNNDVCGGMKMANGTNSLKKKPPFSGTRAKSAAMVRQLYIKAREYQRKVKAAGGKADKMPPRDIGMESLVEVLEGRRIVHHHTHRHDDVLTAIRLSQEFGFRLVLHHVSEAALIAEEIAAAKVPCSIIVIDSPGGKLEAVNLTNKNGAALERAGADVAFHTDDGITDSRLFLRSAAMAVRYGMSRDKALEALTMAGARMMDLQDRIGSLEPGKDADFILLSGDPFSVYTHVRETWIEGQKVYDRENPEHRKYAVGGYNVLKRNVHIHNDDAEVQ